MNFFWTGETLQSDIAERQDFIYTALSETGTFLLTNPAVAICAALLFGWYKGRKTEKEPIPPAVSDFMKSVGLSLFMAAVGLVAGNRFLGAISEMGFSVILIGIAITFLPHILSVLAGKFLLRLSLPSILGGLAGASTCGAALDGLLRDSGNNRTITNSFTVGYAMGNIILTLLGPIIVAILP